MGREATNQPTNKQCCCVKVKESEDRARESEYELRVSHSTTTEMNITVERLKKEASERSAKLKKRDAQVRKLLEEYKK